MILFILTSLIRDRRMAKSRKTKPVSTPDPALAAMRERAAVDRQRKEAEFAARAEDWASQADQWFAAWMHGEQGRAEKESRARAAVHFLEYEEQLQRDLAYQRYLHEIGAHEAQIRVCFEQQLAGMDPLYGTGDRKRYYDHTPPQASVIFLTPPEPSPFAVLGITPGASKDEVKRAYYRMAKQHHPDTGGSDAEFRRVNEAYSKCLKAVGAG